MLVIQQDQGNLEVTITNPAVSEDDSLEWAARMVLENIRHCLVAVYGSRAEVVSEQDGQYFRAIVCYVLTEEQFRLKKVYKNLVD